MLENIYPSAKKAIIDYWNNFCFTIS